MSKCQGIIDNTCNVVNNTVMGPEVSKCQSSLKGLNVFREMSLSISPAQTPATAPCSTTPGHLHTHIPRRKPTTTTQGWSHWERFPIFYKTKQKWIPQSWACYKLMDFYQNLWACPGPPPWCGPWPCLNLDPLREVRLERRCCCECE